MVTDQRLTKREGVMWRAFHDMRRHLDRVIERQLKEAGTSGAEFELLAPLSGAPDGMRARDLGALVGWDRSRIAHMLRRMESRGLIERRECSDDRRGTIVAITEQGRDLVTAVGPGHAAILRRYFIDELSEEEVRMLTDVSVRVRRRLAEG